MLTEKEGGRWSTGLKAKVVGGKKWGEVISAVRHRWGSKLQSHGVHAGGWQILISRTVSHLGSGCRPVRAIWEIVKITFQAHFKLGTNFRLRDFRSRYEQPYEICKPMLAYSMCRLSRERFY